MGRSKGGNRKDSLKGTIPLPPNWRALSTCCDQLGGSLLIGIHLWLCIGGFYLWGSPWYFSQMNSWNPFYRFVKIGFVIRVWFQSHCMHVRRVDRN